MSAEPRPSAKPSVVACCTQCGWLLRAAWMAQQPLSTFGDDLPT